MRVFNDVKLRTGPLVHEHVSLAALPTALPGAPGSFGLKMTFVVEERPASRTGHVRVRGFVQDMLGFSAGAAEIAVMNNHDRYTASGASERHLLALLYSRANSHKL
jgi:hypothetical protein